MYRHDIYIQDLKVETFDAPEAKTMFEAAVYAGDRAKALCALREFSNTAAFLDYKGFFPKPATEIIVSTRMPISAEYWL